MASTLPWTKTTTGHWSGCSKGSYSSWPFIWEDEKQRCDFSTASSNTTTASHTAGLLTKVIMNYYLLFIIQSQPHLSVCLSYLVSNQYYRLSVKLGLYNCPATSDNSWIVMDCCKSLQNWMSRWHLYNQHPRHASCQVSSDSVVQIYCQVSSSNVGHEHHQPS